MKTTLLIDADIVAYKFAAGAQQLVHFDPDEDPLVHTEDINVVFEEVKSYLEMIKGLLEADSMVVCLSCPSHQNFRKTILPSYKENRTSIVKPVLLSTLKDKLAQTYDTYQRPYLEADDVMGILSTHPSLILGRKIIVSEDKDMKTIPGWLFNPRKDDEIYLVSEEEADYWHLYQTLVGDATDNYKGCPGIGPKKAEKILAEECTFDAVNLAFQCKGLTEQDALTQAQVARICRADDYNFTHKHPIPWTPKP